MKKLFMFLGILLVLPICVNATIIDDAISSGTLDIKSIPATSDMDIGLIDEAIISSYSDYENGIYYYLDNCNENYSVCDLIKSVSVGMGPSEQTTYTVKMNYIYDPDVKTVVDNIMKKIPEDGIVFELNDIESMYFFKALVTFYRDLEEPDYSKMPLPMRFSSDYNKFIGYKNFIYEPRYGYDGDFTIFNGGTASFIYDGTIYGNADGIGFKASTILYVDDNETDIVGALKTRLSKYFSNVEVTFDSSYSALTDFNNLVEGTRNSVSNCKALKDEIKALSTNDPAYSQKLNQYYNSSCERYMSLYSDEEVDVDDYMDNFVKDAKNHEYWYVDDVEDGIYEVKYDGVELHFLVIKDSKKVFNDDISVISNDTKTGAEISTTAKIPLDTLIQVAKLTSGDEYEKIVNILNTTDIDVFDLKLFSKSTDSYVTKLDNGKFQVKLPIKEEFKGKDLKVYYINDKGEKEEYPVTIDGDYAVFETDHFSIYTLVAEPSNNPATGDNINKYITLIMISIMGIISVLYQTKKNLN